MVKGQDNFLDSCTLLSKSIGVRMHPAKVSMENNDTMDIKLISGAKKSSADVYMYILLKQP